MLHQMQESVSDDVGLAEALAVARGRAVHSTGESDAKLLAFFLREGECTAEITESKISVWYSWLPRPLPSTYFTSLAPGVVGRLMGLGDVQCIADEASFQVGPGRTGTGRYVFDFSKRWVRIRCEEGRIVIVIRNEQSDLDDPEPEFFAVAQCERCNGELRTPLAKQCLHCGYDWH